MTEPGWVEHAVWWHVYPLGFTGADTTGADRRPRGGFAHLEAWLDYAVELGVSGLALGPVFASSTHGYDTVDHLRVDERLGTEREFDGFLAAAHGRGLRVLLDGVFNHVGRAFPAFAEVLSGGPGAPRADWFRLDWSAGSAGGEPGYATFEGHPGLVALDHANPAVEDYVVRVMTHWLDRGADGWRLDAAYAVPPRFWARVLPRVRAAHPDAYVLGEVIHGDYAQVVADGGLDSLTQYELWKAIWSSLEDRNFFELSWTLGRHDAWLESFVPYTFVGNHDVTRLASAVSDARHHPHALVVLMTVGGTPAVYYGDEQAWRGVKEERVGGDDAIRPAFPAVPADLAPEGWPTYRLHQELIGLRRRHPWLHAARVQVRSLTNTQLVYDAVAADGVAHLRVLLNLDDGELRHPTPGGPGPGPAVVLAGAAALDGAGASVGPHGWAVLGVG